MSPIRIGPVRIADSTGTHEPGTVVDFPHPDLLALAEAKTKDPESGAPYCEVVSNSPKAEPATPEKP